MLTLPATNKRGFTLVEILVVIVIAGLGMMTVAPKLAENTILSDSSEVFLEKIIDSHLKLAAELNTQVHITGYKGSSGILLHDGTRDNIPAGSVSEVRINNDISGGSEYRIYFYPDGIFDQFRITTSSGSVIESYPALHKVVHR
jgi:prepilin-type N-terminal cleavage/methylation domain-containing protein